MAKICPFTNDVVLYLDCKECDDIKECRKLSNMEESTSSNKNSEEESEWYEK